MNSPFFQEQAKALAKLVSGETDPKSQVRILYRRVFARDPDEEELRLGTQYLATDTLPRFAQALLSADEFIFWP